MRCAALAIVLVAGCGAAATESTLPARAPTALADTQPTLVAGEQTTWQVFWRAIAIGRARLVVGPTEARSTFATGLFASALASVHYELVTMLDHGRVTGVTEHAVVDGKPQDTELAIDGATFTPRDGAPTRVPGGTRLHTLHSALGVVRAWARADARPGYLWLAHGGKLYRLDVYRPTSDEALGLRALRVDGVVRALDGSPPVQLSLWLAANRDRTPLRFTLGDISAEVVESTASFASR